MPRALCMLEDYLRPLVVRFRPILLDALSPSVMMTANAREGYQCVDRHVPADPGRSSGDRRRPVSGSGLLAAVADLG